MDLLLRVLDVLRVDFVAVRPPVFRALPDLDLLPDAFEAVLLRRVVLADFVLAPDFRVDALDLVLPPVDFFAAGFLAVAPFPPPPLLRALSIAIATACFCAFFLLAGLLFPMAPFFS